MGNLNGIIEALIVFCVCCGLACWGLWEIIDWLWIDDAIRSTKPIIPEIELVVKNNTIGINTIDTVYVYRQP
jgi:hypothetical protein